MTILMWVFVLIFVLSAVQVTRIAYMNKLSNLYWLAGNFAGAAVGNLFSVIFPVPFLGIAGMVASSICTVTFVDRTFYRDQKSPYPYILGLLLILGAVQFYLAFTNPAGLIATTQIGYAVIWGWQAFESFRARRRIGNDRTVEDWVKARYWLWFSYTLTSFLISTRMLLPLPYAGFEFWITTPITMLAVIVQYITWTMPEPVRLFLNRKYQPVVTLNTGQLMNMSEEEILKQIQA